MIGFNHELKLYKTEVGEGLDTKNLQKNELYDLVSTDYMLPPYNSRGVSRDYLLAVKNGQVFRVTNKDYKHFEFNLQKTHLKKVGIINNALLVKKINLLLKERDHPQLGFSEFDLPEQNWLFKVCRYIDKTNILEFFESAPYPEPPLDHNSSAISKIYYGRLYAGEWLFRIEKAKRNKKLWEAFLALSEKYRTLSSFKVNVEVLEHELQCTKDKVAIMETELHDMIGKVSFTYTALEDANITPELIIAGGEGLTDKMRAQLNTNAQLYTLHYLVLLMCIALILYLIKVTSCARTSLLLV